ncbi:hypothetical protein TRVA0_006S00980 [Trichomonascus vanleenenianus]|uniref:cyclin family protein n=1 Tax=Trichomonascus vanleenenianus TaxID=2268995 RepID=UPI003ECB84A8
MMTIYPTPTSLDRFQATIPPPLAPPPPPPQQQNSQLSLFHNGPVSYDTNVPHATNLGAQVNQRLTNHATGLQLNVNASLAPSQPQQPQQQQQPSSCPPSAYLSYKPPTKPAKPSKALKSIYYNNVANIVCLFWFNSQSAINAAFERCLSLTSSSNSTSGSHAYLNNQYTQAINQLSPLTAASSQFKQFISNVISQTQLPPTAVSLALLYIYRLKQRSLCPIIGAPNSEYRVFSVALILANKFLDDNTYTNKTWAHITMLPLREISAMEIEFLTNMRYSLVVERPEWLVWQDKLKTWLNVAHQAAVMGHQMPTPPTPQRPAVQQQQHQQLTSPPAMAAVPVTPRVVAPAAPSAPPATTTSVTNTVPSKLLPANYGIPIPPLAPQSAATTPSRRAIKRILDESPDSAKRIKRSTTSPYAPQYPVTRLTYPQQQQLNPQQQQQAQPPAQYYYVLKKQYPPSPRYGSIPSYYNQQPTYANTQFELQYYMPQQYTPNHHHHYHRNHNSPN